MSRYHPARHNRLHALLLISILTAACGASMTDPDVQPPPGHEFGFGPRTSDTGMYRAQVQPLEPIRVGRLHGWRLEVSDAAGAPVAGAVIAVDGGMPQHGHGLPTRPHVTAELGDGAYLVEGMRFNMGGWWVVTFRITTASGTDTVTFNLSL